jgi:hypothetical protein
MKGAHQRQPQKHQHGATDAQHLLKEQNQKGR